jgi:ectoine hydroxylase-related dioxygenase (phytanoyl-CoA dioxygenase family)
MELALAKRDLDEFGVTRFHGAASEEEVMRARGRLIEQADAEVAGGCAFLENGFDFQPRSDGANQRVWNLTNKGEIFRRLIMNEVALSLARHLLGEDLLLFSFTANIACVGGQAGALHADQIFAPAETPYALMANCLWMVDASEERNGATRVVPGSHRERRWPGFVEDVETIAATGSIGTIMVWDGRLWHRTGVNVTNEPRRGLLCSYCRPFVRTQENSTLSVSPEALAECSPELLTLLGFRNWQGLGSLDGAGHGVLQARPTRYSQELRRA